MKTESSASANDRTDRKTGRRNGESPPAPGSSTGEALSPEKMQPLVYIERRIAQGKDEVREELLQKALIAEREKFVAARDSVLALDLRAASNPIVVSLAQDAELLVQANEIKKNDCQLTKGVTEIHDLQRMFGKAEKLTRFVTLLRLHEIGDEFAPPQSASDSQGMYRAICSIRSKLEQRVKERIIDPLAGLTENLELIVECGKRGWLPESSTGVRTAGILLNAMNAQDASYNLAPGITIVLHPPNLIQVLEEIKAFQRTLDQLNENSFSEPSEGNISQQIRDSVAKTSAKHGDTFEETYRVSPEARTLRLLHQIQETRIGQSEDRLKKRDRLVRQLKPEGVTSLLEIVDKLSDRVCMEAGAREAFQLLFGQKVPDSPRDRVVSKAEQSDSPSTPAPATPTVTDSIEADEDNPPDLMEDYDLKLLLLEEHGIEREDDQKLIADQLMYRALERRLSFFHNRGGTPALQNAILGANPQILVRLSEGELSKFVKDLVNAAKIGTGLEGYKVFDPLTHPENFCSPARLERCIVAAKWLKEQHDEIHSQFAETRAAASTAQPEQNLINQLARYVSLPNIAYGVMRYGFFYGGSYKVSGVPQGFRDRLLQTVFDPKPAPRDIRKAENQLVAAGFLSSCHSSSKKSDNLIQISFMRDLKDPDKKQLLKLLTDPETRPGAPPCLVPDSQSKK